MYERYVDQLPLTHSQLGTWPTTQACALTGNRTSDLCVCRPALNPLSENLRVRTLPTVLTGALLFSKGPGKW